MDHATVDLRLIKKGISFQQAGLLSLINSQMAEKPVAFDTPDGQFIGVSVKELNADSFLGVSYVTITRWISELSEKGFLQFIQVKRSLFVKILTQKNNDCENNNRKKFVTFCYETPFLNKTTPYIRRKYLKVFSIMSGCKKNDSEIENIVKVLNAETGSKYKVLKSTTKNIKARLAEGYTPDDLIAVIKHKSKQWRGTSMDKYLRPATLFGLEKFPGYLEENRRADNDTIKPGSEAHGRFLSWVNEINPNFAVSGVRLFNLSEFDDFIQNKTFPALSKKYTKRELTKFIEELIRNPKPGQTLWQAYVNKIRHELS